MYTPTEIPYYQPFGMLELLTNCCDRFGDGDTRQTGALKKRLLIDFGHRVAFTIIDNGSRYCNRATKSSVIIITISECHGGAVLVDVVVQAIDHEVVGVGGEDGEESGEGEEE